jgi:hypothetical protein
MLRIFEDVGGIQVMPVLTSFEFFNAGEIYINGGGLRLTEDAKPKQPSIQTLGQWVQESFIDGDRPLKPWQQHLVKSKTVDYSRFIKGGKADVVVDDRKRKLFIEQALEPLFNIAYNHRRTIYAIDVMNEPEGGTSLTDIPKMKEFLSECCKHLQRYSLPSTIGFKEQEAMQDWKIDVDIFQCHYYPEHGKKEALSPVPGALSRACLGEMATSDSYLDKDKQWKDFGAWPQGGQKERAPRQVLADRLRIVMNAGYESALLWSATANDEFTRWDPQVWEQVRLFGGQLGS